MRKVTLVVCIFAITLLVAPAAMAIPISWTDWMSSSTNSAEGSLMVGATTVDVSYAGTGAGHAFVTTGAGTNYWTEGVLAPYTGGIVDNAPPPSDIVALYFGGTVTISFSETVSDPYLALVSWNGNAVEFGTPIDFISSGTGFWGTGTFVPNGGGTGFSGSGELHGVIRVTCPPWLCQFL